MKLRKYPLFTNNLLSLASWCQDYYLEDTRYPVKCPLHRFAIGVYQIHQGMDWHDKGEHGVNEYESFASAAVHFVITSEMCKLMVWNSPYWDLSKLETAELNHKTTLYNISKAQQQLSYSIQPTRVSRKSRYKPIILETCLRTLAFDLLRAIPSTKRAEAIENATTIMTGRL